MSPVLSTTDAEGIVTLTLNDPATRNAISDLPMVEALVAAFQAADADPAARVIILTGVSPVFSSGGNIKAMVPGQGLADPLPARTRQNYRRGIRRLPQVMEALELPAIAVVNGPAIGAGCDLTLMCDPRIVAFVRVCEMALTGDPVDAAEALRIGLISRLVPAEDLLTAAQALARGIAAHPPHAVRMTQRLLRRACAMELDEVPEASAAFQALAHATRDHAKALATFTRKRPPVRRGD